MFRGSLRLWVLLASATAAVFSGGGTLAAPVTANLATYTPGNAPATYQNANAALGLLNGDTGYGGLHPFNPAFSPNDIVQVGEGGSLTLRLSTPVAPNGRNLGVYSNVGFQDASADGSGMTDGVASTLGQVSRATVSVSQDGVTFVALNGGNPVTFSNPTNYYTDTPIVGYYQTTSATQAHASQSKPFLGGGTFGNNSYDQIKSTLNNSAGGTWLDLRGTVATAVNYVKFTVAAGSGDRMIVDAIGGLGAVNTLTPGGRVISEQVGTGIHTSDVVIDFGPQSYDFKIHYGPAITGEQALQLLATNTDFRLTLKTYSFGDLVTGLDYGGYSQTGDGSLGNNYWSYYLGDGSTWSASGQGAGTRLLTDGSYDGWVWNPAKTTAPSFATVPEPTTGTLAMMSLLLLARRRK